MNTNKKYRIWLTNHLYFLADEYDTMDEAIIKAKSTGFQCSIYQTVLLASYCPIAGWAFYGADKHRYIPT
jgi:hypothetical protein